MKHEYTIEEKFAQAVIGVLLANEQELSDGYRFYCAPGSSKNEAEGAVNEVLNDIVGELLGELRRFGIRLEVANK